MEARGSSDSFGQQYRPDVDGLRAIAVLSVILFHVDAELLPGGYLGVDVFFVISGFLITTIIRREQLAGSFSLKKFYERRVRRIMPALIVVLLFSTVVSSTILLPSDLIGYGKSLLSTLAFGANIYFFRDTNYFAAAAESKPLLHMWSLGVEEQFYLFFPLLLIFLRRYPRVTLPAVVTLTALSLAGNMAALYFNKANPAFYLIPFRAWELGVGAAVALVLEKTQKNTLRTAAAVVGLALLVIALAGGKSLRLFSTPEAVLAVVGTGLLIWAHANTQSMVSRLLASKPLVLIGLISYSLYLWHWPLLVLSRYYNVQELSSLGTAAIIAASIGLAGMSFRYIETPFRQKQMTVRRVYMSVGAVSAIIAICAALTVLQQGFPGRLNSRASAINQAVGTNYRCPATSYLPFGALYACPIALQTRDPDDADIVLFGNSHAQMYVPAFRTALEKLGRQGLLVPANACLPSISVNVSQECTRIMAKNLEAIEALPRANTVVLAYTWFIEKWDLMDGDGQVLAGDKRLLIARGIADTAEKLIGSGKKVIVVGPIAVPGYDVASIVSRNLAFGHEIQTPLWEDEAKFLDQYGEAMRVLQRKEGLAMMLPHQVQCDNGRCHFIRASESFFADSNHLAKTVMHHFEGMFFSALSPDSKQTGEPAFGPP